MAGPASMLASELVRSGWFEDQCGGSDARARHLDALDQHEVVVSESSRDSNHTSVGAEAGRVLSYRTSIGGRTATCSYPMTRKSRMSVPTLEH